MGHGDACGTRHGDRAGDTGDHGHRHARGHARLQLFEAATVDIRIAALESHDELALFRLRGEDVVDGLLFHGSPVGHLRGVDDLHLRTERGQELRWRQPIRDDDVGSHQQFEAAHGDEVGVAWATTD